MSDPDDVAELERHEVFRGYFTVEKVTLRHRQFAGGIGQPVVREVLRRGDAVAVLPYDPVRDCVVLIEQFRIGPYARGDAPWLVEIVAGVIEAGETAEAVARREAEEEAGLALGEVVYAQSYYSSPGTTSEHVAVFIARVDSDAAGGVHGLAEEGEDIRVLVMDCAAAMAALAEGRIQASPAVVALQWLALNREALRRRWSKSN